MGKKHEAPPDEAPKRKKHDYETDPETMAGRMWLRMQEVEVTPLDLAVECGVTVTAVTHWLKGKAKNMKAENLFSVSDYLGLEARWLGIGEGKRLAASLQTKRKRLLTGRSGAVVKVASTKLKDRTG